MPEVYLAVLLSAAQMSATAKGAATGALVGILSLIMVLSGDPRAARRFPIPPTLIAPACMLIGGFVGLVVDLTFKRGAGRWRSGMVAFFCMTIGSALYGGLIRGHRDLNGMLVIPLMLGAIVGGAYGAFEWTPPEREE